MSKTLSIFPIYIIEGYVKGYLRTDKTKLNSQLKYLKAQQITS